MRKGGGRSQRELLVGESEWGTLTPLTRPDTTDWSLSSDDSMRTSSVCVIVDTREALHLRWKHPEAHSIIASASGAELSSSSEPVSGFRACQWCQCPFTLPEER